MRRKRTRRKPKTRADASVGIPLLTASGPHQDILPPPYEVNEATYCASFINWNVPSVVAVEQSQITW
jgi:hypothetical protein